MIILQTVVVIALALMPWILLVVALVKFDQNSFWGWLLAAAVSGMLLNQIAMVPL